MGQRVFNGVGDQFGDHRERVVDSIFIQAPLIRRGPRGVPGDGGRSCVIGQWHEVITAAIPGPT